MNQPLRVALVMPLNHGYCEEVVRGLAAFVRPERRWLFRFFNPVDFSAQDMRDWKPDSILAFVTSQELGALLQRTRIPCVNIADRLATPGMPHVGNDNEAIGEMGARYFLQRGYRNFGFVWLGGGEHLAGRANAFVKAVREAGCACPVLREYDAKGRRTWQAGDAATRTLTNWLTALPKPAAVMGVNDYSGWKVTEVCQLGGINVPGDLAVLGVDNVDALCRLAWPALSSVQIGAERIGYEAGRMLERLMENLPLDEKELRIPPHRVITRQSSERVAVDQPDLAEALKSLYAESGVDSSVESLARVARVSRRVLELRFRKFLGCSPHDLIRRVRLERARQELIHTDYAMPEVARRCGFSCAKRLSESFSAEFKLTPTEYRGRYRV